ncbi:MAG: hypothetical protein JOZ74_11225 [Bradyrhizobium sp.]|nr:hypothetical protein [Bradyrhizobium sp.]
MRLHHLFATTLLATVSLGTVAHADNFSTSAVSPGQLPANGTIAGAYPSGGNETRYYFTADLKPGVLSSQIAYKGAPDSAKTLELAVANAAGREIGSYYIKSFGENYESARGFRIDNSGPYTIRIAVKGPEAASFKVDLGGSSLAGKVGAPLPAASGFSRSFLVPSALPADGVVAGTIPAGRGAMTSYYFTAPLKAGKLISQIGTTGSGSTSDMIELALLNPDGTSVDSYYTKSFEKHHEATKTFNVDNSANYVLKVTVQGAETTAFRAEFGGSAVGTK